MKLNNGSERFVNIGFTSIGRRVELIRSFKNAYEELQLRGNIIGIDIDSLAPALRLADRRYLVPPFTSPDYIPALVDICVKEKIDALFPLIDPDIPLLAKHRALFKDKGTRVAVVNDEAVRITSDKYLTTKFFERLNLPVPWSSLIDSTILSDLSFPLFIKPRNGSAGKNAFKVRDANELSYLLNKVPDPILQECLAGPEITSDVICDLEGELLAIVSRRRLEVRLGEVSKGVTIFDQRIIDACAKIARELPALGPITIQCMMKDGQPFFTEINARFGGGAPLGIAAGVNSPLWLLARIAGLRIEIPALGTYQKNLYMTRRDESFFLTEADREDISGRYF